MRQCILVTKYHWKETLSGSFKNRETISLTRPVSPEVAEQTAKTLKNNLFMVIEYGVN